MVKPVYKTRDGREAVEHFYRNLLKRLPAPPFDQLYIPTGAGRTHVLKFGRPSAPPLVMLHGTASNSASWLGCISEFADRFRVYCVDIPGEPGLSEPVRFTLASARPCQWLNEVINALNIECPGFVTMSLGSWFALNFAIQHPERVGALSMITAAGIVPASKSAVLKLAFFMMLGKTGQRMIRKAICHKVQLPSEALEFQSLVSRHFIPVMETIPVFSDAQLERITAPIQFFGGDRDIFSDAVKTGNRLKQIFPGSDINILEDTGHVITDRFPRIKSFMASCSDKKARENKGPGRLA